MVSQLEVFWNFQAFFAELATPTAAHNPSEFGGATHITYNAYKIHTPSPQVRL